VPVTSPGEEVVVEAATETGSAGMTGHAGMTGSAGATVVYNSSFWNLAMLLASGLETDPRDWLSQQQA